MVCRRGFGSVRFASWHRAPAPMGLAHAPPDSRCAIKWVGSCYYFEEGSSAFAERAGVVSILLPTLHR